MSGRSSSGYGKNSATWTTLLSASRTIQALAIVGSIRRNAPLVTSGTQGASRPRRSLASRIILLAAVFVAVPVALYQTFIEAEADRQALLIEAVQERGRLVGLALSPLLQGTDPSPLLTIGDELQRYGSRTTRRMSAASSSSRRRR